MKAPAESGSESRGFLAGDILAEKYLLIAPLGAGGMGQVWTAQNLATGAEVALKLLLPSRANCADVITRFRREAHATAQLAHRGIVRVFDLVEVPDANGSVAMVMERLRGKTLAEHIEHNGPLAIDETVRLALPVLGALHHVHRLGLVHRDLKPENVFLALEPDGEIVPKLLDFGISKRLRDDPRPITLDGFIVGTPSYMSPEQVRGGEIDARTDLFSMGIVLYMCLTGANPFGAPATVRELWMTSLERRLERPVNVPPALWRVIARAMAYSADDRFASAQELAEALAAATCADTRTTLSTLATVTRVTTDEPPLPWMTRIAGMKRRHLWRIAIFACIAALTSTSLGWSRYRGAAAPRVDAAERGAPETHRLTPSVDRWNEPELTADLDAEANEAPTDAGTSPRSAKRARTVRRDPCLVRDPGF